LHIVVLLESLLLTLESVLSQAIDLAEDLIARFKALFGSQKERTQSTVAIVNGVRVEAFPSHHVDTMRGLQMSSSYYQMKLTFIHHSSKRKLEQ
jgi:hypothetical protein